MLVFDFRDRRQTALYSRELLEADADTCFISHKGNTRAVL